MISDVEQLTFRLC